MEYKEIVKSAIQSLRMNIMRTSLTMVGIIIGITAVILIYSIGQGAVAFITNEFTSFGTDYFQINPGSSQLSTIAGSKALTFADYEAMKNDTSLTNVRQIAPFSYASVPVTANDEQDELLIYGVTPEAIDILRPDIVDGEFITDDDVSDNQHVAVIGTDAAKTFFGEDTSPVGQNIRIGNQNFRIVGLAKSSSVLAGGFINNSIFVPIFVVTDQMVGNRSLQEIDVSVKDTNSINETMEDVETLLRDRHHLTTNEKNDFRISSAQDILTTIETITGLLAAMIAGISGISLLVGGVGVMNIMLVSVTERTKEIGLLKAVGAKEKDILTQFLVEAVVMTVSGGIVGIILGISGAFLVSQIAHIPFVVSIPAIIVAVGVSTLVGIIFGLYPALRAARLSPIDALRYE